jgi:ADP-heptose:LPS heptosyltransferase
LPIAPDADVSLHDVREIAVLRALALGDLLCAVPAFRALRGRFPDARITLIGLPWARDFVARFGSYVDEHVEFPGFPGIPEGSGDPDGVLPSLLALRSRSFDLAIQLQGNGLVSNVFTALLGARVTAGFVPAWMAALPPPAPGIWVEYDDRGPEPRRLLRLPRALGAAADDDRPEFPVTTADEDDLARALASVGAPALVARSYAVVHPGASDPARRWDPEAFARAAEHLAGSGLRIVLTGSESERDVSAAVAAAMTTPAIDLAGRTTLGALGALVRDAALTLTNDTGVSHVSAGVRTPSVIVCSQSDPERWAPLDRARHLARGGRGRFPEEGEVIGALDVLRRRFPHARRDAPTPRHARA